jgi:hypothetical protein
MADKKKSIIEEALLDATRIQEALNANTQEILRSVAREEIDGLVKESLYEDDYEEEDVDDTEDMPLADTGEEAGEEAEEDVLGGEDMTDDYGDEAGMDDMEGGEAEASYDDGEESEEDYEMDMTDASDDDVISVYKKLSGDDEIEVVSDNEVHIKDPVSGSEYHVKLGGDAEEAELGIGDEMDVEDEYSMESSNAMAEEGVNEEVVYEIALGDEEVSENEEITEEVGATADGKPRTATSDVTMGGESSAPNSGDIDGQSSSEDKETSGDNLEGGFDDDGNNGSGDAHAEHIMNEEDVNEDETVTEEDEVNENEEEISEEDVTEGDEVDETKYVGGKAKRVATAHTNKKLETESVKKYKALVVESTKLKKENEEFRGALKKFRQMLGETVVFNTNLTNVTRLFTEHSTTKDEKESIIRRFDDEVSTIKESKKLYKAIANELSSKKPISESVESTFSKGGVSAQSTSQLNESTAYVDIESERIKDLIKRVEAPKFN